MTPRPQTERILAVLSDGDWHHFDEIKAAVGAPFSMLERRGELKREGKEIERRGEWYRLLSERASGTSPSASGDAGNRAAAISARSDSSQPLSPRPAASSPPPSARRATPSLCAVDPRTSVTEWWGQNTEWSKRVSGAPVAERPTRPDVEVH